MAGIETTRLKRRPHSLPVRWLNVGLALVLALAAIVILELGQEEQAEASPATAVLGTEPGTGSLTVEGGATEPDIDVISPEEAPAVTPDPVKTNYRLFLGQVRIPAPFPIFDGEVRNIEVPMLMYHYISPLPYNADAIRRDLTFEPEQFARHLERIRELGYETVTIRDIVEFLNTGAQLPQKPIVLTFDDGYVDHYVYALPALLQRDMVGTFFIVSDFPYSGNTSYMDWGMVRELARAGMEVESHAQLHKTLANRNETYLKTQAENTLRSFQQELGYRPRIISYPGGFFDAETIRVYKEASFWAGITTLPGNEHSSDDLFRMRRVRLHGGDDADRVEQLLSGEEDHWLGNSQP